MSHTPARAHITVFESVGAEIIGAMILGGTLASEAKMPESEAISFVLLTILTWTLALGNGDAVGGGGGGQGVLLLHGVGL